MLVYVSSRGESLSSQKHKTAQIDIEIQIRESRTVQTRP